MPPRKRRVLPIRGVTRWSKRWIAHALQVTSDGIERWLRRQDYNLDGLILLREMEIQGKNRKRVIVTEPKELPITPEQIGKYTTRLRSLLNRLPNRLLTEDELLGTIGHNRDALHCAITALRREDTIHTRIDYGVTRYIKEPEG